MVAVSINHQHTTKVLWNNFIHLVEEFVARPLAAPVINSIHPSCIFQADGNVLKIDFPGYISRDIESFFDLRIRLYRT